MRDLTIGKNEAGQRMDKYLKKYFPEAGSGFLYKMLRKKNILLNEKKADGKEMLKPGDRIRLYLAVFLVLAAGIFLVVSWKLHHTGISMTADYQCGYTAEETGSFRQENV